MARDTDLDADHVRWITSGEAARRLGVSSEAVRRWVDADILEGFAEPRNVRHRYFVSLDAVENLRQARRGRRHVDAEQSRGERQPDSRLTETPPVAADLLSEERDRYRAENSALKEVLLRLNTAMEHMEQATTEQAAALREQREALALLVTPHSPGDGLADDSRAARR